MTRWEEEVLREARKDPKVLEEWSTLPSCMSERIAVAANLSSALFPDLPIYCDLDPALPFLFHCWQL